MDLIHLQSKFFPAKCFFCILEKGILAGKKFTLQRRLFGVLFSILVDTLQNNNKFPTKVITNYSTKKLLYGFLM
jgi:hypothetical protein